MSNPPPKDIWSNKYQGTFAWGFLEIAKISLLNLKKRKNIGKEKLFPELKKEAMYNLHDKGLWIAIIWNIKHAVELIIKTIGIQIDKKYWKKHDLDFLIKDLELKLTEKCRTITITKLKKIVEKYYRSEMFVGRKIVTSIDRANDIFKYTNNRQKSDIDFQVLDQLTRKDITAIEKDIDFLRKLFSTIETEVQFVPQMKKWGLSLREINSRFRGKFSIDKK